MQRRILCLWFPHWAVQRAHESGQGALAVHLRDPRRGECIAAANFAAQQAGVRPGMPLVEAQGLVRQTNVKVQLAKYDAATDRKRLTELAGICERYSPLVGLGESYPAPHFERGPTFDCLVMDVTSIAALFGGEDQLAQAIVMDTAWRQFAARVAIADHVSAAWALAHFAADSPQIVGNGWQAMQSLPLAALRLPEQQVSILHELGLEYVAQLAAIPLEALAERFGLDLVHRIEQANGQRPEIVDPIHAAPEFKAEWLLEYPLSDRLALENILVELTQRLGTALKIAGQGALRLACRLDVVRDVPQLVHIGLCRPTANAKHFMELLRLQGEALKLRGAVGRIGLAVTLTARLEPRQRQLFADTQERNEEELASLVNRLSNRLGRERVTRPKLTRDPLPERGYELQPLTNHEGAFTTAAPRSKATAPSVSAEQRPLTLLPSPEPIEVVALAFDGPPRSVIHRDQHYNVLRAWGPERIETSWWRGPSARRDYYQLEVTDGYRFWVFRDLKSGKWFLHGYFD